MSDGGARLALSDPTKTLPRCFTFALAYNAMNLIPAASSARASTICKSSTACCWCCVADPAGAVKRGFVIVSELIGNFQERRFFFALSGCNR